MKPDMVLYEISLLFVGRIIRFLLFRFLILHVGLASAPLRCISIHLMYIIWKSNKRSTNLFLLCIYSRNCLQDNVKLKCSELL